jgi:hypothetical protein
MSKKPLFYLDSDVFIAAKNAYYAFSICPGFWKSLIHHHGKGRVFSIDAIRREILAGRDTDDLVKWTKSEVPEEFFQGTDGEDVVNAFTEVMLWAQRSGQYTEPAKAKFATEADGWLVAYAKVNPGIVITNEQTRPDSKSRILLPDVCKHFNVECQSTFAMLKELKVSYDWRE